MNPRRAVTVAVLALVVAVLCAAARAASPPKHHPRRPVQVVKVVKERGFSWRDAGIGAAATGLVIALVAGGVLLLARAQPPRTRVK
jgi:hypothetical protein